MYLKLDALLAYGVFTLMVLGAILAIFLYYGG